MVIGATALPLLTLPATTAAQVDLLFYEKAFWTFTRGQRLGDLRRLVRQFNRLPDDVYPVGTHYKTTRYGDDVVLPVTVDESTNPNLNGAPACLDRKA